MFLLGTLRALPPVVNPNLIVIKIFKASVATLFQKLIVRPKFVKKYEKYEKFEKEKEIEGNNKKIIQISIISMWIFFADCTVFKNLAFVREISNWLFFIKWPIFGPILEFCPSVGYFCFWSQTSFPLGEILSRDLKVFKTFFHITVWHIIKTLSNYISLQMGR